MQVNVAAARLLVTACLAGALAAGCQTGMDRIGRAETVTDRAARQSQQGEHAESAKSYEAAARAAPEASRNALWLASAAEWLAAGQVAAAETAVAMLAPPISAADTRERLRLDVELALARGDKERAARLLRDLPPEGDQAELATRARVLFAGGGVADAVATLVAREKLLSAGPARQANQRQIVEGVRGALRSGADLRIPADAAPEVAGWMELGRIVADAEAGALGVQRRLQLWRARYPSHPADESLWSRLGDRPAPAEGAPRQIALLLPLSGRAESAGAAVRDGFLGAYYDHGTSNRPRLKIYDVATRDAPSAYLQALADGSDFVVGPLTREEVAALATVADGRATTLALNFLPDGVAVPERFFQYALSPEGEARLAARRIFADGRTSGVVLVPQSDWGRRVQGAFAAEFAAAGGQVVDQADYSPGTADFNELLRRLLRTTGQRGSAPRPDAQFIFVAAQPVHGRLIRTQLRFNYASALPMYATSDVYDPVGPGNIDLDGVIFPDMPWILDPYGPAAAVRLNAEQILPGHRGGQLGRLLAFGYDAFRMIAELGRMRAGGSTPLPGFTGRLVMDGAGRVHRELEWAQIVSGKPVPLPAGVLAPAT